MIPRYSPTYSYADLFGSLGRGIGGDHQPPLLPQLAALFGARHAFLFDSARAALYTLLKAYDRPGEVILPAYTCIVVPEAIVYAGYQPVFVDLDECAVNVAPPVIERAITPQTRAILATHVFGIPCDVEAIRRIARKHDLLVIEDAAPALGARIGERLVGTFGDAALISFQSTKVVAGESGGALLTDRDDLAHKIAALVSGSAPAAPGWMLFIKALARKAVLSPWAYPITKWGYRLVRQEPMYEIVSPQPKLPSHYVRRCSQFSEGLISRQIGRLEQNLARRRRTAQIYLEELANHPKLMIPPLLEGASPAWIQFPILVEDKKAFYEWMQRHGIDLSWTYRYSCADSYGLGHFPVSQKAAQTVVGLPIYPALTDQQAHFICRVILNYQACEEDMEKSDPEAVCQTKSVPKFFCGFAEVPHESLPRKIRLAIRRRLNAHQVRVFKTKTTKLLTWIQQRLDVKQIDSGQTALCGDRDAKPFHAGQIIRVRSEAEIRATLNPWGQLRGCMFMPEMLPYCDTIQRVYKRLERFVDERDYHVKKANGVVLLEGLYCRGTSDYGRCDRSCFYFWREEWLESAETGGQEA